MADTEMSGTKVQCPDCLEWINVGAAGIGNLDKRHRGTKSCKKKKESNIRKQALHKEQEKMKSFFAPRVSAPRINPTVVAPPPVIAQPLAREYTPSTEEMTSNGATEVTTGQVTGSALLDNLQLCINQLPLGADNMKEDHPLAVFAQDPVGSVPFGEDAWEVWDGPLNSALQRSPEELGQLMSVGRRGVKGIYRLLCYLVSHHNIPEELIEGKVKRLVNAINSSIRTGSSNGTVDLDVIAQQAVVDHVDVIDLSNEDAEVTVANAGATKAHATADGSQAMLCTGVSVSIPTGRSAHTSYPFALHATLAITWNYSVVDGRLILHAHNCSKVVAVSKNWKDRNGVGRICQNCQQLEENEILQGIIRRMEVGVHPNARLAYHSIGGMMAIIQKKNNQLDSTRFRTLNNARKLIRQGASLEQSKELIMAIGSGRVERVERVLKAGLTSNRGLKGLIVMYERAATQVYRPRTFDERDAMRGLLLWRMGGARVAEVAYRSLGLPSLSTLRRNTIIPPLIASTGKPSRPEIERNIQACFSAIEGVVDGNGPVHQILMLDELKVEGRLRYDERTNSIVGVCREHAVKGSLEYSSKEEPNLLVESLRTGDIHLGVEATVGAIGLLCGDTRLYSARPILVSASCKRETGSEHAKLIQTCIDASKKTTYRTISIASDGESRRGEALIQLTFKKSLAESSPIYPLLSPLPFMNLEVGDDDITADKDYKHVFKRLRNLLLRSRGFKVHGIAISSSSFRAHLRSAGLSQRRIDTLLKPDDKQDVKLAYDLLQTIWSLPVASNNDDPSFATISEALHTLGLLFQHLVSPYISIDMSLSEQLVHLSAAAHIVLGMLREDNAGSHLMPSQLYLDIMIMIKNAYFCVAKAKVDHPDSQFWIILLGTDRLEVLFGILRTMVGNDANLDTLQLVLRLTGTTEVSTILAKYPEWDRGPRRLKLPVLSKDGFQVHQGVDHVNPASWRGNVNVNQVNLQTCWTLGRQSLVDDIPRLHEVLAAAQRQNDTDKEIDIMRPFGDDIVRSTGGGMDDEDDTAEDYGVISDPVSMNSPPCPDIEDAATEELPTTVNNICFDLDGIKVYKSRYLNQIFKQYMDPSPDSQDRLKRLASIPRYAIKHDILHPEATDVESDAPVLRLCTPIATLVRCDERLFVCVGEVTDLTADMQHCDSIPVDHLERPNVFVTYQVLFFVPATLDDDRDGKHDWCWSLKRGSTLRVSGRLAEPINPSTSTVKPGKPTYLLESSFLMALGPLLLERLIATDGKSLPELPFTSDFPYSDGSGKACFLCKDKTKELELLTAKQCPRCSPTVELPATAPRVLEHMAAHILFDTRVIASTQPCGLCLRPAPECCFYLKKGKGTAAGIQVDIERSTCANPMNFSYSVASVWTEQSPCTNVPVRCPECIKTNKFAPGVWRYNMVHHMRERHSYVTVAEYDPTWTVDKSEREGLRGIWNNRHKKKQTRKAKTSKRTMVISDAHRTSNILRCVPEDGSHGSQSNVDERSEGQRYDDNEETPISDDGINDNSSVYFPERFDFEYRMEHETNGGVESEVAFEQPEQPEKDGAAGVREESLVSGMRSKLVASAAEQTGSPIAGGDAGKETASADILPPSTSATRPISSTLRAANSDTGNENPFIIDVPQKAPAGFLQRLLNAYLLPLSGLLTARFLLHMRAFEDKQESRVLGARAGSRGRASSTLASFRAAAGDMVSGLVSQFGEDPVEMAQRGTVAGEGSSSETLEGAGSCGA
ncbi:hypothetical protein EYR40_007427 [Pleurotus pulmonarius]|nr:hypothetical protein EYR38_008272 [Pleurotus pulmonarius]KAF4596977.1 hypothetical protein EYR40_007427 [Pleurotus pulmonarius]